uniref:Putative glycosyltransferase n=1 Tax=viral metagenome TaxID=1070528 RepID=A0A6M3KWT8_9ZZZZ
MHFVYAYADGPGEWNTSEWRGRTPSDGINKHPKHSARLIPISDFLMYWEPAVQAIVGPADVIIAQRNLIAPSIWEACDYWRGLGKLILADLDDDYPKLLPQNPAYRYWILDHNDMEGHLGRSPVELLTEGFRHTDGLISPNEYIVEDWQKRIPGFRGYWVPNYANWEWYKDIVQKPSPGPDEQIVIGWGGSISHFDGWWFSGLREAVPIICKKYPRVQWKICGGDGRIKELMEKLAPGRWLDQDSVPPHEWPGVVASFDIGIAPLCGPQSPAGESYDLRRSWLKAVEYILTGTPWVASQGIVYEKLDGRGGRLIPNTAEAWVEALSDILDNLEQRRAESAALMEWGRDNLTMEHVVDDYVKTFERIVTEYNAAKGARLPDVLYSKDFFRDTPEVAEVKIGLHGDDEGVLQSLQERTMQLSNDWHGGALQIGSVDLGACLQYPFLNTVNEIVYRAVIE